MMKISLFIIFFLCLVGIFQIEIKDTEIDPRKTSLIKKEILTYIPRQVNSIDPLQIETHVDNVISMTAYGRLVLLNQMDDIEPYLAKKW